MVLTIVVTIAVLAVLILVHELGHFVAARAFDIRVLRFSIGFGPKVAGIQRGETEYRVGSIPLGGYVKLAGMDELSGLEGGSGDDAETDPTRTFRSKSLVARTVVLSAGVAMNALLAVILFALVAAVWGAPEPSDPVVGDVVEEWVPAAAADLVSIPPGTHITRVGGQNVETMDDVSRRLMQASAGPITLEFANRAPITIRIPSDPRERRMLPIALTPIEDTPAVVGEVVDGGPADAAGLMPGDSIVAIGTAPVHHWQEMARIVERQPGQTLSVGVRRDDDALWLDVTPTAIRTSVGTVGRIGARPDLEGTAPVRRRLGVIDALGWGVQQSAEVVILVGDFFAGLVQRRYSALDIGGPLLIGELSGAAARAGLPVLLFFTAMLSINLAVINLLPIPALDGGQLVMLGVETVRGQQASERARKRLGRAGVALVAAIMLWALAADILRLLNP